MKPVKLIPILFPLLAAACALGEATAQSLSFSLDRPGSPPAQFAIHVDEATGHGRYRGVELAPTPGRGVASEIPGQGVDVPITVGPEILKKLFAAVPTVRSGHCETHNKKVAQTGAKKLRYEASGAVAECTFNYSDEDRLNTATGLFEAIGETMQYGDRLAAKLRFDRLGLDLEMDNLASALADSRALEVGNIAPVLQSIQNDDRVMDRVRRKAAHLLEEAGVPAAAQKPATPDVTGPGSSDR